MSTAEWAERLEIHARVAKMTFTEMLAENGQFAPMIIAFRQGTMICMAVPGEGAGRVIAATARAMASGFHADSIMITSDTYGANRLDNPLTGERWATGEMEDVALNHDGIAKGWVHEALILNVLAREGRQLLRLLPYLRGSDGRTVTWLDDDINASSDGDLDWQTVDTDTRFATVMTAPLMPDPPNRVLGRKPTRGEMDLVVAEMLADPDIGGCQQVMLLRTDLSDN